MSPIATAFPVSPGTIGPLLVFAAVWSLLCLAVLLWNLGWRS